MPGIQILILAAGKGRRMGSIKQLLTYLDRTLLDNVIALARSLSLGEPLVILGHESEKIRTSLAGGQADFAINPEWNKGMGNTLAYGVKEAITKNSDLDAVLVLLADQPRISKTHLMQLVFEYRRKESAVIATAYPNGGGVPAIFDKSVFPDLLNLDGDHGARQIIRKHSSVTIIPPTKGEIWDVDTPEDYRRLLDDN